MTAFVRWNFLTVPDLPIARVWHRDAHLEYREGMGLAEILAAGQRE
jgi:hypothetical protein